MAVEFEFENELTLRDYVSIARRRWLQILATFLVSLCVITIIAFSLPPVYKAGGTVAIESPVISKALIGNEASAARYLDEHLDKIRRKIFSRENLVHLNEKYRLYPAITKPSLVAEAVKRNIKLVRNKKSVDGNEWSGQVTVSFSVEVEYSNADTAYKLANDIISQLMDQNTKDRTRRATETTSFLTDELSALQDKLVAVEDKVAAYKQKHSDSLPEHQQLHMTTLDEWRTTLKNLDIEYQTTQEELRYLDVELTTTHATLSNANNGGVNAVSELDKARAELDRSMVLYKETHPTIRALKRKVALLEKSQSAPAKPNVKKVNVAVELAIAKINSQTEAAKTRLASIAQEKRFTRAQIAKVKKQVINIPQVERGLASLLRDYKNVKNKYEDVRSKQVNAKIAENLELDNKAERFVLIESPEYPQYKRNMSKSKMIGLGFPISLALGFGLAFLLETLDKRVRRQGILTSVINAKPLAVIPYIQTQVELNKKRKLVRLGYFLSVAALICLLIALVIHYFVTPLGSLLVLLRGL